MKWILYGLGVAILVGSLAWFASTASQRQPASLARNDSVDSAPRDIDTEFRAYEKASEDFIEKQITLGANPNVGVYDRANVVRQPNGDYSVSLPYQGRGQDGGPAVHPVDYGVRCSQGLCMVITRPVKMGNGWAEN
jgi:hypothetical protein